MQKLVAKEELIGLDVEVVETNDPTLVGLRGVVVDESRNTLLVERESGREARVPKRGQTFAFTLSDGSRAKLEGTSISFAPQDRTKKAR